MNTGYRITTDVNEMDLGLIHREIGNSYWAAGIPAPVLRKAIDNSLCFAILLASGQQVGFARMITDRATFAYLADVFIVADHQGKGLSKRRYP